MIRTADARAAAHAIVSARKALALGYAARLADDSAATERLQRQFGLVLSSIPLPLRMNGGDMVRVADPTMRRIRRDGLLATREWATPTEPKGTTQ